MKVFLIFFLIFSTAHGNLNVFVENQKIENENIAKLNPHNSFVSPRYVKADSTKNIVEDKIIEFLEEARKKFGVGFEESGIPPLDPFTIENVDIAINQKPLVVADFNLSNISVVGLQDFIIEIVRFNMIALTFKYEFIVPELLYTSQFSILGKLAAVIPMDTAGDIRLQANGMHISGNATMRTDISGYISLKSFFVDFDIEEIEVHISNLIGDGQINNVINWVLNQLSDDFFQGQRDRLNEFASKILFDILEEALGKINLGDLIGG